MAQGAYQVRLDWGGPGLARLAPADIVVVVDVLRFSSVVSARVAAGERVELEALRTRSLNGAAVAGAAADLAHRPAVVVGSLRNAAAVAELVIRLQNERGGRVSVAVIPCGELESDAEHAALRFAIEDLLGAGAVIAALGELGIDHSSPEAAVACEAYRALRRGARHLIGGSGSGRELIDRDERQVIDAAVAENVDATAPVLRDGSFAR